MSKNILIAGLILALSMGAAAGAEEITIVGTGSGSSVLKAIGEAFTALHPDIRIRVPKSIGSSGGIKAVGTDEYVLGRVARDIKETEKSNGLTSVLVAHPPIVFFVNRSVTIESITPEQACAIYSGKIRRWEEVGGGKGKIRVIRREEGDSSLSILLKTLPGFKDITLTNKSKTTYTDGSTVEECQNRKNAIAFGPASNIKGLEDVRVVHLDGVAPTQETYPCIGMLSLIYKEQNYNGSVKKFVEFATSAAAHRIIKEAGALPAK
jgi:phosphate transport system substrate-binding protein